MVEPIEIAEKNEFESVKADLLSYLDLEDGWDGYGGSKPNPDVIASSIELLHQVNNFGLVLPKTMVSGSGEVSLYWDVADFYVEIGFKEKDRYTYLIVINDNEVEGGDDFDLLLGMPSQLREALEELTRKAACSRL
jgi:hypothetical protein